MQKPTIEKITILHKIDESPDFSYLETEYYDLPHGKLKIISSCQISQSFADQHPRLAKRYIRENQERLAQFNNGNIWQIGIYAEATIRTKEGSSYRLETLSSGALWGIESDSGPDYIKEVDQEQLADLKDHLEAFNVDTSNFDELAKNAETKDD